MQSYKLTGSEVTGVNINVNSESMIIYICMFQLVSLAFFRTIMVYWMPWSYQQRI